MSQIKFVIESAGVHIAGSYDHTSVRPKRVKHACLACKARKGRCSGTTPCKGCLAKGIACVYREHGAVKRARIRDEVPRSLPDVSSGSSLSPATASTVESAPTAPLDAPTAPLEAPTAPSALSASALSASAEHWTKKEVQMTRQPYFRWLGPTAIAPPKDGTFRLLSVNLRSDEPCNDSKYVVVQRRPSTDFDAEVPSARADSPRAPQHTLADADPVVPVPPRSLYKHFSECMSNYLPYMPYDMFEERLQNGVVAECLLYAMAALAERVTPGNIANVIKRTSDSKFPSKVAFPLDTGADLAAGSSTDVPPQPEEAATSPGASAASSTTSASADPDSPTLAERYGEIAKRLVIPHLAVPSSEIVLALLLIAYSEFADDRDSGLWAWSGMAIRMCYDLGLHKENQLSEDSFGRNVFWSVVCLDRLISCGTGRITTIPDSDIEHMPEPRSIRATSADVNGKLTVEERSDPFPYLCKLLMLLGKVSNYLNSYASRHDDQVVFHHFNSSSLSPESLDLFETFIQFQHEVSDFYVSLPPDLLFDVQNFQDYAKLKHSQVFLLLHIWNQALVLAVHQPSLVYPKCQLDVAGLVHNPHAQLTGTGAISIADMVTFADLIEPESFLANPFLSQPIYMAACASLTLWHSLRYPSLSQPVHTLRRTYNTCRQTLTRMQCIWRGISWHSRTLDSLAASEPDVDLTANCKVYVTTRDLGVVRRASVDEATRRWLADEIQQKDSDDIYGMFISGIIDGTKMGSGEASELQLDGATNRSYETTSQSAQSAASPSLKIEQGDEALQLNLDYKLPATLNSDSVPRRGSSDSFRSLVIRNMNLDEFLTSEPFDVE